MPTAPAHARMQIFRADRAMVRTVYRRNEAGAHRVHANSRMYTEDDIPDDPNPVRSPWKQVTAEEWLASVPDTTRTAWKALARDIFGVQENDDVSTPE